MENNHQKFKELFSAYKNDAQDWLFISQEIAELQYTKQKYTLESKKQHIMGMYVETVLKSIYVLLQSKFRPDEPNNVCTDCRKIGHNIKKLLEAIHDSIDKVKMDINKETAKEELEKLKKISDSYVFDINERYTVTFLEKNRNSEKTAKNTDKNFENMREEIAPIIRSIFSCLSDIQKELGVDIK